MTPEEKECLRGLREYHMSMLFKAEKTPEIYSPQSVAYWLSIVRGIDAVLDPAGYYLKQRAQADAALQDLCVPH